MKQTWIGLAIVFSVVAARADLVIQEKVENSAESFARTIKVKGSKIRVDTVGDRRGDTSMIKDEDTGQIIVLFHKTKTAEKKKQLPASLNYTDSLMPAIPADTGVAEKTGAYDAEIYIWTARTNRMETEKLWVAKDFPDFDRIKADLPVLDKVNDFGNTRSDQPQLARLPGMVVKSLKTRQSADKEQTATVTLVSAKSEPLDDAIFEIPADYTDAKPITKTPSPVINITTNKN